MREEVLWVREEVLGVREEEEEEEEEEEVGLVDWQEPAAQYSSQLKAQWLRQMELEEAGQTVLEKGRAQHLFQPKPRELRYGEAEAELAQTGQTGVRARCLFQQGPEELR